MNTSIYIPTSLIEAGEQIRHSLVKGIEAAPATDFVRTWCALAYLFPGLHPDSFHEPDNVWPRAIQRYVAEAWRRADSGELSDDELYCSDATWAGVFDRMNRHTPEEARRRAGLAAEFGGGSHG